MLEIQKWGDTVMYRSRQREARAQTLTEPSWILDTTGESAHSAKMNYLEIKVQLMPVAVSMPMALACMFRSPTTQYGDHLGVIYWRLLWKQVRASICKSLFLSLFNTTEMFASFTKEVT